MPNVLESSVLAAKQDARRSKSQPASRSAHRCASVPQTIPNDTMREQLSSYCPPSEAFAFSGAGIVVSRRMTGRTRRVSAGRVCPPAPPSETGEDLPEPPTDALTPELVCREYAGRVYRTALRMLGNETDAEDVTQ